MTKSVLSIAATFAVLLVASGCQSSSSASECDGWAKLSPSAETRGFIVSNDVPFAQGVAAHNAHGNRRGCWP